MTRIFIDGKEARIDASSTIKMTFENTYFTKSSEYTYDIKLPLGVAENKKIFGNVDRIDGDEIKAKYPAEIYANGKLLMRGTAKVTAIQEGAVSVQILGGNAAYNYESKSENLYVDELDMGNWYEQTWPDLSYYKKNLLTGAWEKDYYTKQEAERGGMAAISQRCYDDDVQIPINETWVGNVFGHKYPWVAYPTLNKTADVIVNEPIHALLPSVKYFCIQPYLWKMAELVAAATGYTLEKEDNALYDNDLFRRIFIASTFCDSHCNKSLPHWTVNEWWQQLENAFGIVMETDESAKKMRLAFLGRYYSDFAQCAIKNVVDEFSSEVDQEEIKSITSNNVCFDYDFPYELQLPDEILNFAVIDKEYASLSEVLQWAMQMDAAELANYKSNVWRCKDGHSYIYSEAEQAFVEVDMCRARLATDSGAESIELAIIPCPQEEGEFVYRQDWGPVAFTFNGKLLTAEGTDKNYKETEETIDIEKIISDEEEAPQVENQPDKLFVAIENNGVWNEQTIKIDEYTRIVRLPVPITIEQFKGKLDGTVEPTFGQGISLNLVKTADLANLASESLRDVKVIDTSNKHVIKFLANEVPSPRSVFNIRNKLFVCEKIEATANSNGLNRLMTGYFYKFDL